MPNRTFRLRAAARVLPVVVSILTVQPARAEKWPGDDAPPGGAIAAKVIGQSCSGSLDKREIAELRTTSPSAAPSSWPATAPTAPREIPVPATRSRLPIRLQRSEPVHGRHHRDGPGYAAARTQDRGPQGVDGAPIGGGSSMTEFFCAVVRTRQRDAAGGDRHGGGLLAGAEQDGRDAARCAAQRLRHAHVAVLLRHGRCDGVRADLQRRGCLDGRQRGRFRRRGRAGGDRRARCCVAGGRAQHAVGLAAARGPTARRRCRRRRWAARCSCAALPAWPRPSCWRGAAPPASAAGRGRCDLREGEGSLSAASSQGICWFLVSSITYLRTRIMRSWMVMPLVPMCLSSALVKGLLRPKTRPIKAEALKANTVQNWTYWPAGKET